MSMKHRGRRTPQKFMRSSSGVHDYDRNPSVEEAKEQRQGCLNLVIFWGIIIILGIWWGGKL